MRRITGPNDIAEGLDALVRLDVRLAAVVAAAGEVPLRLATPGFASLASIIVSQQVSRSSADAIFGRLERLVVPLEAPQLLAADPGLFREAGLSGAKERTLLALARAVTDGLDLRRLCETDAVSAMAQLTAVPGIGPWTAECTLLFCAGHPDVFPAGDVALQSAVGHALAIAPRPGRAALATLAVAWAPWRAVAARLFWAYYRLTREREAAPLVSSGLPPG